MSLPGFSPQGHRRQDYLGSFRPLSTCARISSSVGPSYRSGTSGEDFSGALFRSTLDRISRPDKIQSLLLALQYHLLTFGATTPGSGDGHTLNKKAWKH